MEISSFGRGRLSKELTERKQTQQLLIKSLKCHKELLAPVCLALLTTIAIAVKSMFHFKSQDIRGSWVIEVQTGSLAFAHQTLNVIFTSFNYSCHKVVTENSFPYACQM